MTWITVRQAMELVGRSRTQIYNWAQHGKVRTTRTTDNTLVIDAEHLLEIEPTITRGRPAGSARPRHTHGMSELH